MEKIMFTLPDGEVVPFYVLEQTRLGGVNYILVTDVEDGDGDAFILKDTSKEQDLEAVYEMLEDDEEISVVATVFENLLDDVEIQ